MPRPPLELESWGKVTRFELNGKPAARAYFRDATGARKRMVRTGSTPTNAERALVRAIKDELKLVDDTDGQLSRTSTIKKLSEEWYEERKLEGIKPGSLRTYKNALTRHILPGLGEVRLHEVTVPRMDRFVKALVKSSGAASATTARVVLKGMFALAVRHGAMTTNPMPDTAPVALKRAKPVAPAKDLVIDIRTKFLEWDRTPTKRGLERTTKLLDACDMLTGTGMRTGEILALQWGDVDLDAGTVSISRTIAVDEDGKHFLQDETKRDDSERTLYLPRPVVLMLERRYRTRKSEFVFPSSTGTFWHPNNFRTVWRNALAGSEHVGVTPKSFRKLVATTLQRALGSRAAGDQLGHSSEKTTETFYIEPTRLGPATDVLNDLFALKIASK